MRSLVLVKEESRLKISFETKINQKCGRRFQLYKTEGYHVTCSLHSSPRYFGPDGSFFLPLPCQAPACKFVPILVFMRRSRPFWWLQCGAHTNATLKWSQSQLFHDGQGQGYFINTSFQGNHSNLFTLTFWLKMFHFNDYRKHKLLYFIKKQTKTYKNTTLKSKEASFKGP